MELISARRFNTWRIFVRRNASHEKLEACETSLPHQLGRAQPQFQVLGQEVWHCNNVPSHQAQGAQWRGSTMRSPARVLHVLGGTKKGCFTLEPRPQPLLKHITRHGKRELVLLINSHPRVTHEINSVPEAHEKLAPAKRKISAHNCTTTGQQTGATAHVFWPASVGEKERETLWLLPKEKRCKRVSGGSGTQLGA